MHAALENAARGREWTLPHVVRWILEEARAGRWL